jgi:hypothetical protein
MSRVSDFIVSDILDSDHLPIIFHILYHINIRNLLEPIEEFTDWDRFQGLASELISPRIELIWDFAASVASAYRLVASKLTLSDIISDISGLDRLLKHKTRI